MKFKLPSNTKELLKNPNETLDNVIKMVTQWDTQSMSYQQVKRKQQQEQADINKQVALNIMCNMLDLPLRNGESTDDTCPYCEKTSPHMGTMLAEEI